MSDYPSDWKLVPIREIIAESRINPESDDPSKRISVRLHCEGVEKRSERATDQAGATRYYKRLAGQFIYGKQNLHKGAVGIVPGELHGFCSSQDIPAFDISPSVDPNWFLYLFRQRNFYESLENIATGTGSKRIQPSELGEKEIAVPPLPEQKKIAEILSGLDQLISATQRKVGRIRTAQEGLANSWQEWVSLETEEGTLGDLIASIDSGWSPACDEVPPKSGEWGVLKVSAVTKGYFCEEESKRLPSNLQPREQFLVKKNDVLITRANGNLDLVGRGAIVENEPAANLLMSDKILRLNPNAHSNRNFLLLLLNSRHIRQQIETAVGGSTGAKNIGQSLLRQISTPVPISKDQARVGNLSCSLSATLSVEKQRLDYLVSLKKGLSADLLSGRKRVSV